MSKALSIHWFRQDLRLADNPALSAAVKQGDVLPIYILDDLNPGEDGLGAASRWWLHHSLAALNDALEGRLRFYRGDPEIIIDDLCARFNITHVYWNRCYEPWQIKRDKLIKQRLTAAEVTVTSFNGSLLVEPWVIAKKDGSPYKIFTPYSRQAALALPPVIDTTPACKVLGKACDCDKALSLTELELLPRIPWYKTIADGWQPGEIGAHGSLNHFLEEGIHSYKEGRDFPAKESVSRLSPHLHFGEISPRQVWSATDRVADDSNSEHFKRELLWREFSYYLLFHWPQLPRKNLKPHFDYFPWQHNKQWLRQWQQGLTGYPLVDAGMRELWQTGFMHNRVRMIVASFLVKNLLIDWRHGSAWFWDCLVDADLASNSASWQWVAGCGTDASPYFRIFNPIIQGEKFDPHGAYTKRFVPELKDLPDKYLFKPWQAPNSILQQAGVKLGENYPVPVVDIKSSRESALSALQYLNDFKRSASSHS